MPSSARIGNLARRFHTRNVSLARAAVSRDGDDQTPFALHPLIIYGRRALVALRGFRDAGTLSAKLEFTALSEITDGIAGRFVAKYGFIPFGLPNSKRRIWCLVATAWRGHCDRS
jgi:hypothetical protein